LNKDGSPTPIFEDRLRKGFELYRESDLANIIISGGVHDGRGITEARAGLDWYRSQPNIPVSIEEDVILEGESLDTITNAIYLKNMLNSIDPAIGELTVVTSDYHAGRVEYVFNLIFGEEYTISIESVDHNLPDPEMDRHRMYEMDKMVKTEGFFEKLGAADIDPNDYELVLDYILETYGGPVVILDRVCCSD